MTLICCRGEAGWGHVFGVCEFIAGFVDRWSFSSSAR